MIIAFDVIEDGKPILVGYKNIGYHMIFDVKQDLIHKCRLAVECCCIIDVSPHASYSSVASRKSVRMGFLFTALNNIDILACDIGNAYLNAPNREKSILFVRKTSLAQLMLKMCFCCCYACPL